MVDPNRKINRMPEKDINFLEECESEFALRYTTDDEEFMAHCAKAVPEPPLVDNWSSGGGGGGGGGGRGGGSPYNNRYNGGHRRGGGDRGWGRRGGGGGGYQPDRFRDNRRHRHEEYPRRDHGGGRSDDRPSDRRPRQEPQQRGSPMNVRRDYGNFVPASRD